MEALAHDEHIVDWATIEAKLLKYKCRLHDVQDVVEELKIISNKLPYDKVKGLTIYLVFKNNRGSVVLKSYEGGVVYDILDTAYTISRELMTLENWNVHSIFKVSLKDIKELKKVRLKELKEVVTNVIKPRYVTYSVGTNDESLPNALIDVDLWSIKGIKYADILRMIAYSYAAKLGVSETMCTMSPRCDILSYSLNS
ncbi:hypothetical protein D3C76_1008290 [compost metagenome]